jgi:membrane fusion protein (multidrug efflux system)
VRLLTRDESDALVLPEQALVPQGESQYVFRVVDGKAVFTMVEVGQRREGRVEIIKGVSAGDTIVTAGQLKLRDGMQVTFSATQNTAGNGVPSKSDEPGPGAAKKGDGATSVPPPKS